MKRFTETNKWRDPWFMGLTPTAKLLWLFLLDHCDNAGVVEPNTKLASFQIGEPVKPEHFLELESRLKTLTNGKLLILKFIGFQFGSLVRESRVHSSVLKLLESHGLEYPIDTLSIPYVNPIDRVAATLKEKEKEKEPDKDKERRSVRFTKPTIEMVLLHSTKIGIPGSEGEAFWHYYESNGWRVGKNPMRSWHSSMINWRKNWQAKNGASHNVISDDEGWKQSL